MTNIIKFILEVLENNKKQRIIFFLSLLILILFSSLYIRYTWISSKNETSEQALKIAQMVEASFDRESLLKLSAAKEDIGTEAHESIKNRLINIVKINPDVRFAYIYMKKGEKLYFVADSEPSRSKDYSPAGQELTKATDEDKMPFTNGMPVITNPAEDQWGTWVSVLIPMKDYDGKTVAVFGMDYPAKTWNDNAQIDTFRSFIIVIAVILIAFGFYIISVKNLWLNEVHALVKASEEKFSKAFQSNGALMAILTVEEERYIDVNDAFLETLGYEKEEIIGKKLTDLNFFLDCNQSISLSNQKENHTTKIRNVEVQIKGKDGSLHSCIYSVDKIALRTTPCFIIIMIDITERKKAEEKIFYLSYYDQLTGLYNRRFYEEELKRLNTKRNLPLTLVMGDVNGLKVMNDSLGHTMGDELLKKAAEVIKKCCRADDIIARIGGDEFILLLPKTDGYEAEKIIKRINELTQKEKVRCHDISISFGYETKKREEEDINAIFKAAENNMYIKKQFESPSMRGRTIHTIMSTLHEKNKREEIHSHKVSELCQSMGSALNMSDYEIIKFKTVGLLHDIGKIAIEENIINKPGKLTEEEWSEIKRHTQIGHTILMSSNDMYEIAEYVLSHHERWDGEGYPQGLKKEEIPLISRVVAIADSYDAMTSDRSYRCAMPEELALKELKKNAGTQFDPHLVDIFIDKVLNHK